MPHLTFSVAQIVVLPPSLGAEQPYQIIEGHLDDLASLTKIKNAPMRRAQGIPRDLAGMRDGDGRNPTLFDRVRREGHHLSPTIEAFAEFARRENAKAAEPMEEDEVIKVAANVLKYRLDGTLWSGGIVAIDHRDIDGLMMQNPDAYLLYSFLQRHHWGRDFPLANELASRMPAGGWSRKRFAAARAALIEAGFLMVVRPVRFNPSRAMTCRLRR